MASAEKISCQKRDLKTKGHLKQLKRSDFIPGVVYGKGMENLAVSMGQKTLVRTFNTYGSRGLFSLEVEGEEKAIMAVVREIQRNPISGQITHIDFWKVNLDEKINSSVGITIIGEEELMKTEGIMQVGSKEIEISCLPQELPDNLTCDVSGLQIGDKITVGDLEVPEGVEILTDLDSLVVTILAPSREEEEEVEEEEEGTEDIATESAEATETTEAE
jgi:large subunit ribosomal protein L25